MTSSNILYFRSKRQTFRKVPRLDGTIGCAAMPVPVQMVMPDVDGVIREAIVEPMEAGEGGTIH
jgi:hypothetical protein